MPGLEVSLFCAPQAGITHNIHRLGAAYTGLAQRVSWKVARAECEQLQLTSSSSRGPRWNHELAIVVRPQRHGTLRKPQTAS